VGKKPIRYADDAVNTRIISRKKYVQHVDSVEPKKYEAITGQEKKDKKLFFRS